MVATKSKNSAAPQPTLWVLALTLCLAVASFPNRSALAGRPSSERPMVVRDVRVRLATGATRVRIRSNTIIRVVDSFDTAKPLLYANSWHVFSVADRGGVRADGYGYTADALAFEAEGDGSITLVTDRGAGWSPGRRYAGLIRVQRRDDGKLDIVNAVDVERYVASVVAHEVWPTFAEESFRAQAIAARTYVLYTMLRRRNATYDVHAGQGAQVYRGIREDNTGRHATQAAKYTRGVVCIWNDEDTVRLFSAFYSAVCGGVTQSAAHFGSEHDIKPLSGGARCDYCKDAPGETYRWGPVKIDKGEVRSRLVARNPKTGFSGSITKIEVVDRSPQGRPVKLRITGSRGKPIEMSADSFRLAVGVDRMRSTDCTIRVTGRHIVLEAGRGFGHGVGLCQWGADGLAKRGRTAAEILRFYYPGSSLVRAY